MQSYVYNGRGEQVRKYTATYDRYVVYDESGHWLGEYHGNGDVIQLAIWMDDLPVGVWAGHGGIQTLHYVQPDHLGTPRVVIDPARNVAVWNWDLKGEAFGSSPPNDDPDGDGNLLVFNARFPGQRFDAISGLNQNAYREYEAGIGRYIQSDLIGLRDGISSYSYASGNPLEKAGPKSLLAFGPTCSNAQRIFISNEIVRSANDIKDNSKSSCKNGNCDLRAASEAMRFLAGATSSCDYGAACATTTKPNFVYLYPPYIGALDPEGLADRNTGCGCFRSTLFHEALHQVHGWSTS